MKVSVEKPGTPSELVHFGVKGMKWGVRKVVDTAIGTKTAGRKPSSYKKPLTAERQAKRKRRRTQIKGTAFAVGGALAAHMFVGMLMGSVGRRELRDFAGTAQSGNGKIFVKGFSDERMARRVNTIARRRGSPGNPALN